MNQDELKQLISAYIDGEAGPEETAQVLDAIKSEKDLKRFYREIKKLRRNIKKLDDPAAFRAFQKLWRERIGIAKSDRSRWIVPARVTAIVTASLVIVFVGIYMFGRSGGVALQSKDAAGEIVMAESEAMPEMMKAPEAEEEAFLAEAPMDEAVMTDAQTEDTTEAAEAEMRKSTTAYELPHEVLERFMTDAEAAGIEPVIEETEDTVILMIEATDEKISEIIELLKNYHIETQETDIIDSTITIIFN